MKGMYRFPNVVNALENRFHKVETPEWVESMSFLINHYEKGGYFRWHDAGDLKSEEHLDRIIQICENTPTVKHWLPTKEYALIASFLKQGKTFPPNLCVRVSAPLVEQVLPAFHGLPTSSVSTDESKVTCKAASQNHKCLDCRLCWDKHAFNVTYSAS